MLWYKSWLETRSRFLIGLVVLLLSAGATVLVYPEVSHLLEQLPETQRPGAIGDQIREARELSQTFRGYIWWEWFVNNLPKMWALFAVLLGAGGLLSQAARGGGALFSLSLPVSRTRMMAVRAGTSLAELFLLALLPTLLMVVMSQAINESFSPVDALVHVACAFIAGSVLFSLTFLLSTIFNDLWRPPLIVIGLAACVSFAEQMFRGLSRYSLFGVMSAESYFRDGQLPWIGLFVTAAISASLLYLATVNMARKDF